MISLHQRLTRILLKCNGGITINATLTRLKSSIKRQTAGIIVIGDEILKGQVKDTNSFYASELLYECGVKVQKISVVPDSVKDIAMEIQSFLEKFDYVFTSGGIGPTHDDVTYEAMALAFNDTLHYHPLLMEIVKQYLNDENLPLTRYKMAYIPTKSLLKFGRNKATGELLSYPCIIMGKVYIFPGSPIFFKPSFHSICKDLFLKHDRFVMNEIYINAKEESFAEILREVAEKCPNVSFGSYPEVNRHYKVRITIESGSKKDTEKARKMFCDYLPRNVLVPYDCTPHVDCLAKYEKLLKESDRPSLYENALKKFV